MSEKESDMEQQAEETAGPGNERTGDHMDAILAQLRAAWERWPHMRLCQLIVNASGRLDPFYVEDADLMAVLDVWASAGRIHRPGDGVQPCSQETDTPLSQLFARSPEQES